MHYTTALLASNPGLKSLLIYNYISSFGIHTHAPKLYYPDHNSYIDLKNAGEKREREKTKSINGIKCC